MRQVLSSWRRHAALVTVAGVALVAATVAGIVMISAGPATATLQTLSGSATCDCVVKNTETNEYRAVFGYSNTSKQDGKIDISDNNRLKLSGPDGRDAKKLDGTQSTRFERGTHKAAFATEWVSKDREVTWHVGGHTAVASWNKPTCGRDVSLPATGNGSGPLIVLLASVLIAGAAILVRKRRIAARNA